MRTRCLSLNHVQWSAATSIISIHEVLFQPKAHLQGNQRGSTPGRHPAARTPGRHPRHMSVLKGPGYTVSNQLFICLSIPCGCDAATLCAHQPGAEAGGGPPKNQTSAAMNGRPCDSSLTSPWPSRRLPPR